MAVCTVVWMVARVAFGTFHISPIKCLKEFKKHGKGSISGVGFRLSFHLSLSNLLTQYI